MNLKMIKLVTSAKNWVLDVTSTHQVIHTKGRGTVHNTLGEHLRIFRAQVKVEQLEAVARTYNNTIHRATGLTTVEIVFGICDRNRGIY